MTAQFGKALRSADSYYKKALTVPANTSANSDSLDTGEGGQLGQLQAVIEVNEEVSIAEGQVLSATLQDSADDSSFADVAKAELTGDTGGSTLAVGSLVAQFVLPTGCRRYTRLVIATDDVAASGKLDLYLDLVTVPRM